jgi:uncharacterized protein (DUF2236 family)
MGTADAQGLFGPKSATWMVDRELVLFLGGPRALLLQIAHPAIAAAVEEHSDFRADPLGRLSRTLSSVFTIVFGDRAEAIAAAARVTRRHAPVYGRVAEASPSPWSGKAYRAQDPELLLWVHATLVDTAMHVFSSLVRPLEPDEARRYYDESKRVGELLGIPPEVLPPTLPLFRDYFGRMVDGPVLHVGPTARAQREDLTRFKPSHALASIYGEAWGERWAYWIDGPLARRASSQAAHILGAGMLPERLRSAFGYRWSRAERASYEALVAVVRQGYRALPRSIRFLPGYEEALARASSIAERDPPG